MDLNTSLWLFQSIFAVGLALWLSIAAVNNLHAFHGSVGAVGATMSMGPLTQPPIIETPLLSRASGSRHLHRLALLVVLILQISAAVACWKGSYALVIGRDMAIALPWLNIALSGFALFLFAMHLGGLWFAYWIRQEVLQLTHIALLIWTLGAFFLFNVHWT